MRVSHSIKFLTPIRSDYALFKSILVTFSHQPDVDWSYQSEGKTHVVIVDADKDFSQDIAYECAQADAVIYYTNDMTLAEQKPFVLRKPAHAREFLQILQRVTQYLVEKQSYPKSLQHATHAQQASIVDKPTLGLPMLTY